MTKTTKLEKLESSLFRPLTEEELTFVYGGVAKFTFIGKTAVDGGIYNDYIVD